MSEHEDTPDFFDRMGSLLDSIEVRRGEFLKIEPEVWGRIWGRLFGIHDDLEGIAVEIDREVRVARGEKVGPVVSLGTFARNLFSAEPVTVLSLAEITAEIHEALDAKRVTPGDAKNRLYAETPSGRRYTLSRNKRAHEEATYTVWAIHEGARDDA